MAATRGCARTINMENYLPTTNSTVFWLIEFGSEADIVGSGVIIGSEPEATNPGGGAVPRRRKVNIFELNRFFLSYPRDSMQM